MMTTNRRTFLKFLSVSPAIFHASTGFGKIFHEPPKELLSDSELLQAIPEPPPQFPTGMVIITYPGKPTHTGGTAVYNEETDQTVHTFTQSGTLE